MAEVKDDQNLIEAEKDEQQVLTTTGDLEKVNLNIEEEVNHPSRYSSFLGIGIADIAKYFLANSKDFSTIVNNFSIKDGCFGIVLHQPIDLTSGKQFVRTVLNMPSSNFSCIGMNKEIATTVPGSMAYVGCQRTFILEDGSLNTDAAINATFKELHDKYYMPRDMMTVLCKYSSQDSHVYYIYNMLTTWLYSVIFESSSVQTIGEINGNAFMYVRLKKPYYEDSHCYIDYGPTQKDEYITVEVPYAYLEPDVMKRSVTVVERCQSNYFNNNYIIRLPYETKDEQLTFYLTHLQKRKPYNEWVNFDIGFFPTIENVAIDIIGLFATNSLGRLDTVRPITKKTNSDKIFKWIQAYIGANRLYYDYALALELLFRIAFWPVPETQEGCVWPQVGKIHIAMPDFSPTRGLFPVLFEGEPYIPPGIVEYKIKNKVSVMNYILFSAMENYLLIYALQVQIYVRVHSSKSWYLACRNINDEFSLFGVWDAYQRCFETVYKCGMVTNMDENAYITVIFKYCEFVGVNRVKVKATHEEEIDKLFKKRANIYNAEKKRYLAGEESNSNNDQAQLNGPMSLTQFSHFITSGCYPPEMMDLLKPGFNYTKPPDKISYLEMKDAYDYYLVHFNKRFNNTWFYISNLPAWVTGALVDGSIGIDSVYCVNLKPTFIFEGVKTFSWHDKMFSVEDAIIITQMARYFNRDVSWYDKELLDYYKYPIVPWANVRQRVIEPSSFLFNLMANKVAYAGEVFPNPRKDLDLGRNIWSLVNDGFLLSKTRGTFYYAEFLTRERVVVDYTPSAYLDPRETKFIAKMHMLTGRVRPKDDLDYKKIEEDRVVQHFQHPGTSKTDPATMLPGTMKN